MTPWMSREDLKAKLKGSRKRAGNWVHSCGETVLAARVHHPIWDRGTVGGNGEVKIQEIPYCPRCDNKPDEGGTPIYYGEQLT